jgi:hypothetical protein
MSYVCSTLYYMNDTHHAIIQFETRYPIHNAKKADMIREQFGLKESRYYQMLTNLMLDPQTLPEYPQEVNAWLRRRDAANRRTRELAGLRRLSA